MLGVSDALAAFRLTRLVTTDRIFDAPRERFIAAAYQRSGDGEAPDLISWRELALVDKDAPMAAKWITCNWCMGVWVGLAVALMSRCRFWPLIRDTLALAGAVGLLSERMEH